MSCGFASTCGRGLGHPGHHGGWRTGISGVSEHPIIVGDDRLGRELGPTMARTLAEVIVHGGHQEAADCRGVTLSTVKHDVNHIHARLGTGSVAEAALVVGWTTFPPGLLGPAHKP